MNSLTVVRRWNVRYTKNECTNRSSSYKTVLQIQRKKGIRYLKSKSKNRRKLIHLPQQWARYHLNIKMTSQISHFTRKTEVLMSFHATREMQTGVLQIRNITAYSLDNLLANRPTYVLSNKARGRQKAHGQRI